jgi:dihydrofolate synthase/folylpolyglutamate synthase
MAMNTLKKPNGIHDLERIMEVLARQGMRLGRLSRVGEILARCGEPQRAYTSVHVAGTNGKGSVCALLESILRAARYPTGLFTSPHLVSFKERIRINGIPVGDELLLASARTVIEGMKAEGSYIPTYFEFMTLCGLLSFREAGVDYAVLETGLGGRLDATNVVEAAVAAITTVAFDHEAQLGKEIGLIAKEKAAIIKEGAYAVCGRMDETAFQVVRRHAADKGALVKRLGGDIVCETTERGPEGSRFNFSGVQERYGELTLPLRGEHQVDNCAVALGVIEGLRARSGAAIDEKAVRTGIETVYWPGRFEPVSLDPLIIADCAHNPSGVAAFSHALNTLYPSSRWVMILGMLRDKRYDEMCGILAPHAAAVVATPVGNERSVEAAVIAASCTACGVGRVIAARDVGHALARAQDLLREVGATGIVVTGSAYLIGELFSMSKSGGIRYSGGRSVKDPITV